MSDTTETRLAVHEAICAERYKRIDEQLTTRLKREASAITYAAEIGTGDGTGWSY